MLNSICDALALIEQHDVKVHQILIHPSDLPIVESLDQYTSIGEPSMTSDYLGVIRGSLFTGVTTPRGIVVATSPLVSEGVLDVIPEPGNFLSIVQTYEDRLSDESQRFSRLHERLTSESLVSLIKDRLKKRILSKLTRIFTPS